MESRSLAKQMISEKQMKAEYLAFKAGCSFSTLCSWLGGKTIRPEFETAIKRVLHEAKDAAEKKSLAAS